MQKFGRPNDKTPAKWNTEYKDFNRTDVDGASVPLAQTTSTSDVLAAPPVAPTGENEAEAEVNGASDGEEKKSKKRKSRGDAEEEADEDKAERKRKKKEEKAAKKAAKKEKRKSKGGDDSDSD